MTSDTLALTARAAHDWGLASWLGGSMFGQFALNPAVKRIDDRSERGAVVNAAWNGYNAVNALALTGLAGGWAASRFTETRPDRLTPRERSLSTAKDVLTLSAVTTGVASGVFGARLARSAPEGKVPVEGGVKPASDTPEDAAKAQRVIRLAGRLNLLSGVGLVVVNAVISQLNHSRPPLRRGLLRRSA